MTEADLAGQVGIERRRFLAAAGTIAWATPLILTLTAGRAEAQSCVPQNAVCEACTGLNCCISPGDPLPCCCSDPLVPTCPGICRSQAQCMALLPGGPANDPDACFYPGGTGTATTSALSSSGKSKIPTI